MTAYTKNEPHTIQEMFDSIAKRYDLTNAILSFGLHHYWNQKLVQALRQPESHTLIDLCSGTGDIAIRYLHSIPSPCSAYLVDFSAGMLAYAKSKIHPSHMSRHKLEFIEADVQSLPLPSNLAECTSMAYGIRNVKEPVVCLREAFRVLKAGGKIGILELTRPRYSFLRLGHKLYLNTCLPLFGKWLTDNQKAYEYLRQSINTFIAPEELKELLENVGFTSIQCKPLLGGVATLFIGQKPL